MTRNGRLFAIPLAVALLPLFGLLAEESAADCVSRIELVDNQDGDPPKRPESFHIAGVLDGQSLLEEAARLPWLRKLVVEAQYPLKGMDLPSYAIAWRNLAELNKQLAYARRLTEELNSVSIGTNQRVLPEPFVGSLLTALAFASALTGESRAVQPGGATRRIFDFFLEKAGFQKNLMELGWGLVANTTIPLLESYEISRRKGLSDLGRQFRKFDVHPIWGLSVLKALRQMRRVAGGSGDYDLRNKSAQEVAQKTGFTTEAWIEFENLVVTGASTEAIKTAPFYGGLKSPFARAKSLVSRQTDVFAALFPTSGYRSLDEFGRHLRTALSTAGEENARLAEIWRILADDAVELRFHVRPQALEGILAKGYQNMHQGVAGSTRHHLGDRNVSESSYMNAPVDDLIEIDGNARPHYGVVGPSPNRPMPARKGGRTENLSPPGYNGHWDSVAESYGDVVLIYDPKSFDGRLTFTIGDSSGRLQTNTTPSGAGEIEPFAPSSWDQVFLPWDAKELMIPFLVNDPRRTSVFSPAGFSGAASAEGALPGQKLKYAWQPEGVRDEHYFEIQVWGPMSRKKPVAVEFGPNSAPSKKIIETLTRQGIEIRITDWRHWPARVLKP